MGVSNLFQSVPDTLERARVIRLVTMPAELMAFVAAQCVASHVMMSKPTAENNLRRSRGQVEQSNRRPHYDAFNQSCQLKTL